MKDYWVLMGSFGSGKSELAINMALQARKSGPCTLVDLDVINAYFRSSERAADLEAAGVELISPPFAMDKIEILALSPRVYSAFTPGEGTVIFDIGGDDIGTVALGQYKPNFANIPPERLHVLFIVNPLRPMAANVPSALAVLGNLQIAGRLEVTGIVNNGNLAGMTDVSHLVMGYELVRGLSDQTGIPVWGTVGQQSVLDEFRRYAQDHDLDSAYIGRYQPIKVMMHRSWDKYLSEGL